MPDRLDVLLQFYEEDPEDAFTQFALAQEYLKRGDTAQALAFFTRLAEQHPEYVGTYYHLGKLQERLGQHEAAVKTYRQGIQVAQRQRDFKNLSELQDALLHAQGVGFEEDDDA
ncbi:tetratricopeptide repeat protein [Rhodothermaceae bacterium RA]|nr:tetratricopeptide repeat protein [Rhodothermaceae bacterium RA]